ncbi:hypothetical protein DFH29DRAFT_221208 [Suillus ampliporus]|nr:hypothetical protein DFH29DRAFT_221208 [Suillus ampliporus]
MTIFFLLRIYHRVLATIDGSLRYLTWLSRKGCCSPLLACSRRHVRHHQSLISEKGHNLRTLIVYAEQPDIFSYASGWTPAPLLESITILEVFNDNEIPYHDLVRNASKF